MRISKLAAALLAATSITTSAAMAQPAGGMTSPGNTLDQMFPNRTPEPARPAAQPAPMAPAPTIAVPAQAPAQPRPTPAQASPTLPPFLNPQPAQQAAPVPPPMSVQQAITPQPAPQAAQLQAILQTPPPPTPARDIVISDNETSEKIESLNRQRRVLDAELGVERTRVEVAKQLFELRKAQGDNRPMPTAAQMSQMQQAQQAQQAAVAEPDPARELSTLASRMSVLSIAGPRNALRATIMVAGFGEVRAVEGGNLPGGLRVASITDQGVAVSRGSVRPVLLQFAR